MYFLHANNSDRQTRLLNVLGQIAMIMGDKKSTIKETVLVAMEWLILTGSSGSCEGVVMQTAGCLGSKLPSS